MESKENLADEIANLKRTSEINNEVYIELGDIVISTAEEKHVPELAELWANHAAIQHIHAPQRYDFRFEGSDWQAFVRKKMSKKYNLLLTVCPKNGNEVQGFVYLQTVTIPSSDLVLKGVIEDLYTKPQHRKKGIATNLLNAAMEWGNQSGIKQIDLITTIDTKDLCNFYKKFLGSSQENISTNKACEMTKKTSPHKEIYNIKNI